MASVADEIVAGPLACLGSIGVSESARADAMCAAIVERDVRILCMSSEIDGRVWTRAGQDKEDRVKGYDAISFHFTSTFTVVLFGKRAIYHSRQQSMCWYCYTATVMYTLSTGGDPDSQRVRAPRQGRHCGEHSDGRPVQAHLDADWQSGAKGARGGGTLENRFREKHGIQDRKTDRERERGDN